MLPEIAQLIKGHRSISSNRAGKKYMDLLLFVDNKSIYDMFVRCSP